MKMKKHLAERCPCEQMLILRLQELNQILPLSHESCSKQIIEEAFMEESEFSILVCENPFGNQNAEYPPILVKINKSFMHKKCLVLGHSIKQGIY